MIVVHVPHPHEDLWLTSEDAKAFRTVTDFIRDWLADQGIGEQSWYDPSPGQFSAYQYGDDDLPVFEFHDQDAKTAMLFKLTWGEKE